ncbi:MAG: hypothetical protein LBI28_01940 [Treponema sp.]|jgi:hypothetical protein|nr:hypothetical protein [Treponema sp.]
MKSYKIAVILLSLFFITACFLLIYNISENKKITEMNKQLVDLMLYYTNDSKNIEENIINNNVLNKEEINFPPELLWWINEVKKANKNIEINNFTLGGTEIINFNNSHQRELTYPVFMRWNYSGNTIGYYDYNRTQPKRLASGKYTIGGDFDDVSTLLLADRSGNVFFGEDWGISSGLNAICWLTDTVLIAVGIYVNTNVIVNDEAKIDLFILNYKINNNNKTVEKTTYFYDNAFDNSDRWFIRLNWFEHRSDYFEIR